MHGQKHFKTFYNMPVHKNVKNVFNICGS